MKKVYIYAACCVCLIFLVLVWEMKRNEIHQIERPSYGEGTKQEYLQYSWEEDGDVYSENIIVELEEQPLAKEEVQKMFVRVKELLEQEILGDNTKFTEIRSPLCLKGEVEGYPATIEWTSSNYEIIDWEGNLGERIPESGIDVTITAVIRIQQEEELYTKQLRVYPPRETIEGEVEAWREQVRHGEEKQIVLPEKVKETEVKWEKQKESLLPGIVLLICVFPALGQIFQKQRAVEKKKKEREQMVLDYPEIVSKLLLLLSTGMNLRMAMCRLGSGAKEKDWKKHKVYFYIDEMVKEMEHGISEKEAYYHFGERTQLQQYKVLATLLVQHLQKGNANLQKILEEEVDKAQRIRQQQVKILGEQASTKLLVPMILMLILVFVILIVPVWFSMGI